MRRGFGDDTVLMKDVRGRIIGIEKLNVDLAGDGKLTIESKLL